MHVNCLYYGYGIIVSYCLHSSWFISARTLKVIYRDLYQVPIASWAWTLVQLVFILLYFLSSRFGNNVDRLHFTFCQDVAGKKDWVFVSGMRSIQGNEKSIRSADV